MDITINELEQLMPDSYRLLDMRGDVEVGHGMIPGAIHMSKDSIFSVSCFFTVIYFSLLSTPSA